MSDYRTSMTDEAFARWVESEKPCRYCNRKYVGPICPYCERPLLSHPRKR